MFLLTGNGRLVRFIALASNSVKHAVGARPVATLRHMVKSRAQSLYHAHVALPARPGSRCRCILVGVQQRHRVLQLEQHGAVVGVVQQGLDFLLVWWGLGVPMQLPPTASAWVRLVGNSVSLGTYRCSSHLLQVRGSGWSGTVYR